MFFVSMNPQVNRVAPTGTMNIRLHTPRHDGDALVRYGLRTLSFGENPANKPLDNTVGNRLDFLA